VRSPHPTLADVWCWQNNSSLAPFFGPFFLSFFPFQNSGLDVQLILQVHDELVLQTSDMILDKVSSVVNESMKEAALPIEVPVNIGIGENWEKAH